MLDALWIMLTGMGIVFATLALVLLAMMALGRIFKPEEAEGEGDNKG